MSRSWERRVRKNMNSINKRRKKAGLGELTAAGREVDRFRGRNYILPIALILFILFYVYMVTIPTGDETLPPIWESSTFWLTIACYILLAALFFFRRPYLNVGKDYVGTRRMTGPKTLYASGIRGISVQPGYVVIEQTKGPSWVFSRLLNRYPTDEMAERLKQFAADNKIPFEEKTK